MKVILATRNKGKASEIRNMLKDTGLEILTLDDYPGIVPAPETGLTFKDNALIKARHAALASGLTAIADDSGLEVDYLKGRPGVWSARYAFEGATDEENWRKLLNELEGVPGEKRGARFKCVIAIVVPGGEERTFEGTLEGVIACKPSGKGGFGYDPVFYLPGRDKTVAGLTTEEKNSISHRAEALLKLKEWIRDRRPAAPG
ncbi:MAG: XTP/dITP diphosphatase [Deltaproteobacteria bacterium]|nr:XTP/dITP diphosphatase [Deltaproteobacteria bacterium]